MLSLLEVKFVVLELHALMLQDPPKLNLAPYRSHEFLGYALRTPSNGTKSHILRCISVFVICYSPNN